MATVLGVDGPLAKSNLARMQPQPPSSFMSDTSPSRQMARLLSGDLQKDVVN